jgi:hypothetical protein
MVVGLVWLAVALVPNDQDPVIVLRFGVPVVWFIAAATAAVRARRATPRGDDT